MILNKKTLIIKAMKNLIPDDASRCLNKRCDKQNRCNRSLQLKIDSEDFKKENVTKSISVFINDEKNCTKFIEFDDNN